VAPKSALEAPDIHSTAPRDSDRLINAARELVALARVQARDGMGLLDVEVDDVRCVLESMSPRPSAPVLSPREAEVARMVAQGYPNKTIASVLDISTFTVSSYLRRIFAKLGVNSRAAMVARLLEGQPDRSRHL
jgi:DNA-binding CsgD family transcriptional regulator